MKTKFVTSEMLRDTCRSYFLVSADFLKTPAMRSAISVAVTRKARHPHRARGLIVVTYLLGHSEREMDRLTLQSAMLHRTTERLLAEAGVTEGMHVLDVGGGAGDLSIMAAWRVGPAGFVTAVDRSKESAALTADRLSATGLRNFRVLHADMEDLQGQQFDAVLSRYVLIHQADPVAFMRTYASLARPGAIIALHEMDVYRGVHASPPLPGTRQSRIHAA
jgi:2-polyprenyl-3-methyl-5-hydroxy-6-metoxy-1,4-benzoquinol methylase